MGEIRLHMCLDKEMEMLQISKRGEVEKDENRHHLARADALKTAFSVLL